MMQAMLVLLVVLCVSGAQAFFAGSPIFVKPSAATTTAAAPQAQAIAAQAAAAQLHCRQCTALQMSSFSLDHSIDYGDIDEDVSCSYPTRCSLLSSSRKLKLLAYADCIQYLVCCARMQLLCIVKLTVA
jgi:hypothetical protein